MTGMGRVESATEQTDAHAGAANGGVPSLFGPHLSVATYGIFEAGQLLQTHRSARVKTSRRNANLGSHAELAAIGKLG